MFSVKFLTDLAERALKTFLQGFIGALVLVPGANLFDGGVLRAAGLADSWQHYRSCHPSYPPQSATKTPPRCSPPRQRGEPRAVPAAPVGACRGCCPVDPGRPMGPVGRSP